MSATIMNSDPQLQIFFMAFTDGIYGINFNFYLYIMIPV